MEVKLENLIEKLRQEGVEEARKESGRIQKEAKKKADNIVKDAEKKAEEIVAAAEKKAESFKSNSEIVVAQAVRDGVLLFKNKINSLFDSVFSQSVSDAMDAVFLKEMILKLVEAWGADKEFDVAVAKKDQKELEKVLFTGLGKKLKESVTISPDPDIEAGFRISKKGDELYYDFSDESIGDVLRKFLTPKINEIMEGKNG